MRRKIRKEELKKAAEEQPDSYLRELAEAFDCTPQAVAKALDSMGITLKKDVYLLVHMLAENSSASL